MNPNDPPATAGVTEAMLADFSDAWNRHDIEALMAFMSDDCVFDTAGGSEPFGTRHVGRAAVRLAFAAAWQAMPDAAWRNARHHVAGDFGTSQWLFTGTAADGSRTEVEGIDVFHFVGDKIRSKNVYRKARPPLPALPAGQASAA